LHSEKLIDVRDVGKTFHSKLLRRPHVALQSLDLSVEEGEIFGFLGPNGAGKTTTIKILLGLIRSTSGSGQVLGFPFGSVAARRSLGFLPDSPRFYRYLTARELLRFGGKLHGIVGAELARRVEDTLDRVHLAEDARGRALWSYSRGMLQRVGIAAALLHRPRLVILDEPMNGLDPIGRNVFRDLLLVLKSEGVTVFLSSHVLHDIENIADRVGILNEGHLIQCGSLSEILAVDDRHVEIRFEIERGSVLREITPSFDELVLSPQGWFGQVGDPERATRIVRKILESGGRLLRFERKRVSLEEFFLQQISGERANTPTRPDVAASPRNVPRTEADQTRAPRRKRTHEEVPS
jgi:ABC-2 type transport system ATP-binding protein